MSHNIPPNGEEYKDLDEDGVSRTKDLGLEYLLKKGLSTNLFFFSGT